MLQGLKRFFDFPPSLWSYFQELDQRFDTPEQKVTTPASLQEISADLSSIRVVLWDVYGTLCGVEVGDLEKTLEYDDRLLSAARDTLMEFNLEGPLLSLQPQQPPEQILRNLYKQLIEDSHLRSLARGIEYPEVHIEQIWLNILQQCLDHGFHPPSDEPPLHTAYRWAYFFDFSLQQVCLYPHTVDTLQTLKQAGIIQGIISNAQFYTPLHLRRLLRRALPGTEIQLEDFFHEQLVLFSYEFGFSKPNHRTFNRALEILTRQGISPDEILYIGNDMLNDVWAASRAQMRTMLFAADASQTTLRTDDPRCQDLQPDALVTGMNQIAPQILGT